MLNSRVSLLSSRLCECLHVRPCLGFLGNNYHTHVQFPTVARNPQFVPRVTAHLSDFGYGSAKTPSYYARNSFPSVTMTPVLGSHSYSSFSGGKGDDKGLEVPQASGTGGGEVAGSGELVDKVKDVWKSVVDVASAGVQRAKEASDELTPHAQQILDSHPYLQSVVLPVAGTMTATLMAWFVMPRILKRLHHYSTRGSAALLSGSIFSVEVPYEKGVWGALEDPVRYLVTFMAFSQICFLVAPNAIASQFIVQAWKGAVVLSFVWFVHRWKTNLFARSLAAPNVKLVDREKLHALDKISSVGLFALGGMALAEACGVAVQSITTVGGIGGVATAFASRDILGNVLSGLSMQFSKPFSIGDTIKAGSIEGQVVEIGLTTTSLLNAEKFPVIVPNSMFSSQVIVNKSRAGWRAFLAKIPVQLNTVESIPQVSNNIKSMLRSYPKVFLEREVPYCYLSRIDTSYAELTVGCNLKQMSKEERYSTEQDILIQSIQIIRQHGASLGCSQPDTLVSQ